MARLPFPGNILSRSPITRASSMQYSKYCCTRNRQLRVVVRCFGIFPPMFKLTYVHTKKRNKVSKGSGLRRAISKTKVFLDNCICRCYSRKVLLMFWHVPSDEAESKAGPCEQQRNPERAVRVASPIAASEAALPSLGGRQTQTGAEFFFHIVTLIKRHDAK